MSHFVGNPKDRFCRVEALIYMAMWYLHANIETANGIWVLITYMSREHSDKSAHPCS